MKYGINLNKAIEAYKQVHSCEATLERLKRTGFAQAHIIITEEQVLRSKELYTNSLLEISMAISAVEKRCRERKITATDVIEECLYIEKKLGITKKALNGCTFDCNTWGGQFPNCYKGVPEATSFSLLYHNRTWYLTNVYRGNARATKTIHATLTDAAKEAIISNYIDF